MLLVLRGRDLFGERVRPTRADREHLAAARAARARAPRGAAHARRRAARSPSRGRSHFPHVAAGQGFDVVLGNPPWVRLHRIPAAARTELRARFEVFRRAAWERGAAAARAGSGFAAQVDLAALFVERSLDLLRPGGVVALLLPVKLWRSLAGGGVRRLVAERAALIALEDWSDSPHAFDAAVYPSLLVARATRRVAAAAPAPVGRGDAPPRRHPALADRAGATPPRRGRREPLARAAAAGARGLRPRRARGDRARRQRLRPADARREVRLQRGVRRAARRRRERTRDGAERRTARHRGAGAAPPAHPR